MNPRHVICLVVDGLRASALGTYGNTFSPTPHCDHLASRSAVVEWLIADSIYSKDFYRSCWQGVHALRPPSPTDQSSLPELLEQAGIQKWMITDDPHLADLAEEQGFEESLFAETTNDRSSAQLEETSAAQFVSFVAENLEEWRSAGAESGQSSLLWLHTRGMLDAWDAPLAMRNEMLDEEDPAPADYCVPPTKLDHVDDPDELLQHRAAYAAQVSVLDACIGALCEAIEQTMAGSETMFVLIGSSGFALGEHGWVGSDCQLLFSEQIHLPCLFHICGNAIPPPRLPGLAQPADVGATLLDWLNVDPPVPQDGISFLSCCQQGGNAPRLLTVTSGKHNGRAVRTNDWMLVQADHAQADSEKTSEETSQKAENQLFAKPDDRWEHNDVAALCPEIVEEISHVLAKFESCCREGKPLAATE